MRDTRDDDGDDDDARTSSWRKRRMEVKGAEEGGFVRSELQKAEPERLRLPWRKNFSAERVGCLMHDRITPQAPLISLTSRIWGHRDALSRGPASRRGPRPGHGAGERGPQGANYRVTFKNEAMRRPTLSTC